MKCHLCSTSEGNLLLDSGLTVSKKKKIMKTSKYSVVNSYLKHFEVSLQHSTSVSEYNLHKYISEVTVILQLGDNYNMHQSLNHCCS